MAPAPTNRIFLAMAVLRGARAAAPRGGPRPPERACKFWCECRALSRVGAPDATANAVGVSGSRAPIPARGFELEKRSEAPGPAREIARRAFLDDRAALEHDDSIGF